MKPTLLTLIAILATSVAQAEPAKKKTGQADKKAQAEKSEPSKKLDKMTGANGTARDGNGNIDTTASTSEHGTTFRDGKGRINCRRRRSSNRSRGRWHR